MNDEKKLVALFPRIAMPREKTRSSFAILERRKRHRRDWEDRGVGKEWKEETEKDHRVEPTGRRNEVPFTFLSRGSWSVVTADGSSENFVRTAIRR